MDSRLSGGIDDDDDDDEEPIHDTFKTRKN